MKLYYKIKYPGSLELVYYPFCLCNLDSSSFNIISFSVQAWDLFSSEEYLMSVFEYEEIKIR